MENKYGDALIIDDNKDVLELSKSVLEDLNFFKNVHISRDVKDAIRKISNQKFNLIVLDYRLEKETAFDFLQKLDDTVKNEPHDVVICSGFLDKAIIEEAMRIGVKHFITKPFDVNMLKKKALTILVENGHVKLKKKTA